MKILIVYASTEGQTRKIARFCADELVAQGHSVELMGVADADAPDISRFGAVLLAGSVHVGKVQEPLHHFAETHAEAMNALPGMFIQVSLAAAGNDPQEHRDLARIAADFCDSAGWRPLVVQQVAGAFRFTDYDFFKSWAMRFIAAQKGETVDPKADKEYTDWAELKKALADWPPLTR